MSALTPLLIESGRYSPIHATLLSHLEASDIIRLQQVSKALLPIYKEALKTQWNINTCQKRFFKRPIEFRNVQAATGAIITNDVARGSFERHHIPSHEKDVAFVLDIIVESGTRADALTGYVKDQGYADNSIELDEASDEQMILYESGLTRMSTFTKQVESSSGKFIKIIVHHSENLLAFDKAYCLFPVASKEKVSYLTGAIASGGTESYCLENRRKYRDNSRGFSLRDSSWLNQLPEDSKQRRELGRIRQFGDHLSWVIDLDLQGIAMPEEWPGSLDFATFTISEKSEQFAYPYLEIFMWTIQSVVLRYRYPCSPLPEEDGKPYDEQWIGDRFKNLLSSLQSSAIMQFDRMEPSDRPVGFEATAEVVIGSDPFSPFAAPDGWNYYDAAVQAYLLKIRDYIRTQSG